MGCGLTSDGAAYCWSRGSTVAEPVEGTFRFISITAGTAHACGLTAEGNVLCWGNNERGQLGTLGQSTAVPTQIFGSRTYRFVEAGALHTCAITTAGAAYCWGDMAHGQSGNGGPMPAGGFFNAPLPVQSDASWQDLTAGARHTCGRTTDGDSYCWGANSNGQVGDGTTTSRPTPVGVDGGR